MNDRYKRHAVVTNNESDENFTIKSAVLGFKTDRTN